MKIFVQLIDTCSGIFQHGVIDEPIKEGFEVANAIGHFGVDINTVEWNSDFINGDLKNHPRLMTGTIIGTSKVLNVVVLYEKKI